MAITKARMQMKRGNEADFDPSQMLPGEWAVSLDTKYVRMCFAPGICVRMATYDAFEADMEEVRDILLEAQTIQEAVARIQTEINDIAVVVEDYSTLSKSYAVGGTGKRENEDSDNAKYYYEQTKQISQGINGIVPMGTVAFADLPTSNIVNNAMYNVSDAFTSDARFNDGGGIYYGPGNNVIWTAEGKWDVTASSSVTGIKGSAESTYRQGNVNITAENIGLGNVLTDLGALGNSLGILDEKAVKSKGYAHIAFEDSDNDFNNWTIAGMYAVNNGALNAPPGVTNTFGTLLVLNGLPNENSYVTQIYRAWNRGSKLFYRVRTGTVWSDWEEFATKNSFSDYIVTREVSIDYTARANSAVTATGNLPTINGYTPILATVISTGSTFVFNYTCGVISSSNTVRSDLRNVGSEDVTATLNVRIVYVKNM